MSDLFELTKNGIVVYSSGGTVTPGPTPPGPVVPGPVVPGPVVPPPGPPTVGPLAEYDSRPSSHAKIIFMTDAENTALQVAGRASQVQMARLIQWFFYNGLKTMSKIPLIGGGFYYTYQVELPSGQWVTKIDNGSADLDSIVQPVPRAP